MNVICQITRNNLFLHRAPHPPSLLCPYFFHSLNCGVLLCVSSFFFGRFNTVFSIRTPTSITPFNYKSAPIINRFVKIALNWSDDFLKNKKASMQSEKENL